ncbi:MAG: fused MFS/spermidine synthase [Pseudomonadota bacterium]
MSEQSERQIAVLAGALFFVSGAAALIYEVLWMKELALLFGNSAQAAAAALAAFFTGIAAGNAYWGRRAATTAQPLRAYGWLEIGVALSAGLYFFLLTLYDWLYGALYEALAGAPLAFVLIKFLLALALFFPAAFFMGGTLPMMAQYLVRRRETLGARAAAVYAINTLGAASGALAAAFLLPRLFGFDTTYAATMGATLLVAAIALLAARRWPAAAVTTPQARGIQSGTASAGTDAPEETTLSALAALSGFATLALQVLWIRMFSQVLHNSVYSYATILSVFLLALAVGGACARLIAKRAPEPRATLIVLLTASGLLIAGTPLMFEQLTNSSAYQGGDADFGSYAAQIVWLVTATIGLPVVGLGVLLPYLFKLAEPADRAAGEIVGRLITVNTLAAIAGSIAAGFFLLGTLGLWWSVALIAGVYLLAAAYLARRAASVPIGLRAAPLLSAIALAAVLDPSAFTLVRINADERSEQLLQVWEGADATVAVVRRNGHLRTKLNNWYALGSTGDVLTQEVQTHLPMQLHPNARRVFYLGLGTGITAGAALSYPVEEVVVAEIAPSVIRASRDYFGDFTAGLFDDERVRVVAEDGRNVLRGTDQTFDLIISDLFVPWRAGVGSLYSVDHYRRAATRLPSDGLYVQWLPLYQLTDEELGVIARSMLGVFPMVSMWRGNYWADRPVLALIGHKEAQPLSANAPLLRSSRRALAEHRNSDGDTLPLLAHYAGRLSAEHELVRHAATNSDDRPVIDYLAPINHRREKAGLKSWFVNDQFLQFIATHVDRPSLQRDVYLSELDPAWHDVIQAGYYLQVRHKLQQDDDAQAELAGRTFNGLLTRAARAVAADS